MRKNFIFGLDLGQQNDYTALIILERTQADPPGRSQPFPDPTYQCPYIERMRLGMSYPDIVNRVKELVERPEIVGEDASEEHPEDMRSPYDLVVDQTGVGRPVFDMLTKAGLRAVGVTITGGDSTTQISSTEYRVAKRLLVSGVLAALSSKRLKYRTGMPYVDILQSELSTFNFTINDNANDIYGAREGAHDDLVLALALAIWCGETLNRFDWLAM